LAESRSDHARAFTWSSERIGRALGVSPFTTGVLIVSAGLVGPVLVPQDLLSVPLPVFGASALVV
jgi:hypothetical protein